MIALGIVAGLLIVLLALQAWLHQRERDGWATERRSLVDRALARHAGEVIALDRSANPPPARDPSSRGAIVGLES